MKNTLYLFLILTVFGLFVPAFVAHSQSQVLPVVENNVILNNTAEKGGGLAGYNTPAVIRNNLFIENTATTTAGGGAIYSVGTASNPKITGNTVAKNSAPTADGGGISILQGQASILNSILWQNQGDLYNTVAAYSDVTSLTASPGTGNISADPAFVQTTNPDSAGYYRLNDNSPCVDKGDPLYQPNAKETDIKGKSRVVGPMTDMGADEVLDTTGPVISDVEFGGTTLANGMVLRTSGSFTLNAADPSRVSKVEFSIDSTIICTDTNGSTSYSCAWDIYQTDDGPHSLTITAYDTLGTPRIVTYTISVALNAPVAPAFTSPANGAVLRTVNITVTGQAEKNTTITLYNNGVQTAGPIAVDPYGVFRIPAILVEGTNRLQAAATNRAGTGPLSTQITITLDTSIPKAPAALTALSKEGGVVALSWNAPTITLVKGYNVYRASTPFASISQAIKANTNLVAGTSFNDLPPADGTYYYALSTIDKTDQESPLSTMVSAFSDRTAPRAVSIEYTPSGHYSPSPLRIAQGLVAVRLTVSEPLLSTPFLSITPGGGVPMPVGLAKTSDLVYTGSFTITDSAPTGTAYAVFSARDSVGNRGTDVDSGASFIMDAQGPALISIDIQPKEPVRNYQATPASIVVTLGLDETMKTGAAPEVSYMLSGSGRTPVPIGGWSEIAVQPGHTQTWQAVFTLLSDAGLAQTENLRFIYRGIDDLDNVSTGIQCADSFQVYQGDLPALMPPVNLAAKALSGGRVRLAWSAVGGAAGYQLYRKAPGGSTLAACQTLGNVVEYVDNTATDGSYQYAVASIRSENGQNAVSGLSNIVEVSADSLAPGAPQDLALSLTGSGIKATWTAPPATEPFTYSLYRSSQPITSVAGMTPIGAGITTLLAVDSRPSLTDHNYVVTAVDVAGNESLPSNSFYLNFSLLPVATLKVVRSEDNPPLVSWTHMAGDIIGYNIYLGSQKLNSSLITGLTYTDTGYTGDERRYTVTAVDQYNTESLGRTIVLPRVSATINTSEQVHRGIMNRLEYAVDNRSALRIEHARLKTLINNKYSSQSQEFSVDQGLSRNMSVPAGGQSDLPGLSPYTTTIEITPEDGELVQIVQSGQLAVVDDTLSLNVFNQEFTRGGTGKVRFALTNTGEEEIEILTAAGPSPSTDISFSLQDKDGNVLSTQAFKQNLGDNVVTLPIGRTVARIPAGATFTSDEVTIPIPSTAPDQVVIRVSVGKVYFHLGQADQVTMNGLFAVNTTSLKDTPYYGDVLTILPQSSAGDEDIVITGRAIDRATSLPLPDAPLKVVIATGGFDRAYTALTDGAGGFSMVFKPLAGESDIYSVRAVHPDVTDRTTQGTFVISKLSINPTAVNLNIPKNYEQTVNIHVTASEGSTLTNLRFVYDAADQTGNVFPPGVNVTPGPAISLGSKQAGTLSFKIWADNSAASSGRIFLKIRSDNEADPWGTITVNTSFTEARPALSITPDHVETGVSFGTMDTVTVVLENKGLADLTDVSLALVTTSGLPAPSWAVLNSSASVGTIAVGNKHEASLSFSPLAGSVAEGVYQFSLRITSSNYPTINYPVYVAVTQSGIGGALFKVSDIYTGTLNAGGQLIQGLATAAITLQNEQVTTIRQTKSTDSLGEALFTGMTAGVYKYRITAPNHQEQTGRFWIKPGITAAEQVFLEYNLVTVTWEVRETTIKDTYEIVLTAVYETNVPAPVLVLQPTSVTLPAMKPGDVYNGEITITNQGLVRADDLTMTLPPSNSYYKYEVVSGIPASLGAKEKITVPYRVTALSSADQSENGSGGGCSSYVGTWVWTDTYPCANGSQRSGSASAYFTHVFGTCSTNPTPATVTISGGTDGGIWAGGLDPRGHGGDSLQGTVCPPPKPERPSSPEDPQCCTCNAPDGPAPVPAGSTVDPLRGEYLDDITDLSVKAPGRSIEVKRRYYNDAWHFDTDAARMEIIYGSDGVTIDSINKGGVTYTKADLYGKVFSFRSTRTIYVKTDGFLWEDKTGNRAVYDTTGRMTSYGTPTAKTTLIYESGQNGQLIGVLDNTNTRVLWYEYNADNRLSVVRDAANRKVRYEYDPSGRLSKVIDVNNNETAYTYDASGRLASKTDAAGRVRTITYNNWGYVASVKDGAGIGKSFDYSYDSSTQQYYTQVRYPAGKIVEEWYDRRGNTLRTDINGRTVKSLILDGSKRITTDAAGNKTIREYDNLNNLLKQTNPDTTTLTYEYESRFNNVVKETNEKGIITTYNHDSSGNLLKKTEAQVTCFL